MTIYRLSFNHADFLNLDLDLEALADEICVDMDEDDFFEFSWKNLSLKHCWKDVGATFVDVGLNSESIPDITIWNSSCLFLSPKAYQALSKKLEPFGEFLPVTVDGEKYHVFNCLNLVEADPNKSEADVVDGLWQGVRSIGFEEQKTLNQLVFKTKFDRCQLFDDSTRKA